MGEIDGFLLFGATIFTAREPFKKGSISIRVLTLLRVVFVGELLPNAFYKPQFLFEGQHCVNGRQREI
jgi:hypothetical protein